MVTRPDLVRTNALFQAACRARGLDCVVIVPGATQGVSLPADRPRLLYRAATDWGARLVEQLLARPGDALLHEPGFICAHQGIQLRQAGLPVARTVYLPNEDPEGLAAQAAWLGGYPVVVKRPGTEGGAGVSLAQSLDELTTQMSVAPSGTQIEAFVPHIRCWRLTVLGARVLAATASIAAEDDFRTNAAGSREDPDATLPQGASEVAIQAVTALRLDFGGVDLMEGEDGALTIAEVNFPCYFAQQQDLTGIDIAGAVLDYLCAKHA